MLFKKIDNSYKVKIQGICPNIYSNNCKSKKIKKLRKKCTKFRFNISRISKTLFINIWREMKYKNLQITKQWLIKYKLKIALIKGKFELSIHAQDLFAKILWFKLLMVRLSYRNSVGYKVKKPAKKQNNFRMILICLIYNLSYKKPL